MTHTYNKLLAHEAAEIWQKVQDTTPLIHCITNTVVQNFTANILLASGSAPAMVETPGETDVFAQVASGVLINLGTLTGAQQEIIPQAAKAANESDTPWVMDPVAVGALPTRTKLAVNLLRYQPQVIRGNASEILGLSKAAGGPGESAGRGVETGDDVEAALPAAQYLTGKCGAVIAASGPVDGLIFGEKRLNCANGSEMLTKVTGGGCALGAFITAFLSTGADRLKATAAAHATYGIAAQRAAKRSNGPGSFAINFLDELYNLKADEVEAGAKLW